MRRALFEDNLEMDFSVSIGSGGIQEVGANDWVAGAAAFFDALDATQHNLTPYRIVTDGDEAYVSVLLHVRHYKRTSGVNRRKSWSEPVTSGCGIIPMLGGFIRLSKSSAGMKAITKSLSAPFKKAKLQFDHEGRRLCQAPNYLLSIWITSVSAFLSHW